MQGSPRDNNRIAGTRSVLACVAMLCATSLPVMAVEITVAATGAGKPLADAVVSLQGARPLTAAAGARAVMDQHGSQFEPHVLAVQSGTSVAFPNSDQIQHQVYSFSAAKKFDLPLYAGTRATPIRFDQAGVAVLGCNIHDWMIGYVVVLETPYFGKTDAQGRVVIDAPAGTYRLRAWHERLNGAAHDQEVVLMAGKPLSLVVNLNVTAEAPVKPGNERLKALQEKFRRIKPAP